MQVAARQHAHTMQTGCAILLAMIAMQQLFGDEEECDEIVVGLVEVAIVMRMLSTTRADMLSSNRVETFQSGTLWRLIKSPSISCFACSTIICRYQIDKQITTPHSTSDTSLTQQ